MERRKDYSHCLEKHVESIHLLECLSTRFHIYRLGFEFTSFNLYCHCSLMPSRQRSVHSHIPNLFLQSPKHCQHFLYCENSIEFLNTWNRKECWNVSVFTSLINFNVYFNNSKQYWWFKSMSIFLLNRGYWVFLILFWILTSSISKILTLNLSIHFSPRTSLLNPWDELKNGRARS